ncbi:hypothetical protein [Flavobacterium sp. LAR06]|uniref:hypothetical protein n=1 Tax=Flavobacterium sp. LAR06 TaxID=3064897 RepID=UPI0035C16D0D
MSEELDRERINEIYRQKLGNLERIEEKAMFLRQPPSSLTQSNTTSTTTNTGAENQNQSSSTDNKKGEK